MIKLFSETLLLFYRVITYCTDFDPNDALSATSYQLISYIFNFCFNVFLMTWMRDLTVPSGRS
ncbi:hypothetical protein EDF67_101427 [Sphingobacterium sp. JUb78]|nr:hypothetical protein EDF67_101427 [Sphingobacterium sp. JUb78]